MLKTDVSLIRKYASDVVRYARNKDERTLKSQSMFYDEGKKAPGVAKRALIDELNSNIEIVVKRLKSGEMSTEDALKANMTPMLIGKLSKTIPDKVLDFQKAYKNMYPKTGAKRNAVEEYLATYGVTSSAPTKNKKFFKRIFAVIYKIREKTTGLPTLW